MLPPVVAVSDTPWASLVHQRCAKQGDKLLHTYALLCRMLVMHALVLMSAL